MRIDSWMKKIFCVQKVGAVRNFPVVTVVDSKIMISVIKSSTNWLFPDSKYYITHRYSERERETDRERERERERERMRDRQRGNCDKNKSSE